MLTPSRSEGPTHMKQIARSWRVSVAGLAVGAPVCWVSPAPPRRPIRCSRPGPVPAPSPPPRRRRSGRPGAAGPRQRRAGPRAAAPGVAASRPPRPRQLPLPPRRSARLPPPPAARPDRRPGRCANSSTQGRQIEPQRPEGFNALDIICRCPRGWTQVPDPNVPDAFAVIANRRSASFYTSNAQLVVYRLVGDFDPMEAITHGYVDSQQLPAWQPTNASLADFNGFPSSIIEGTYREGRDDAQHLPAPRHRRRLGRTSTWCRWR